MILTVSKTMSGTFQMAKRAAVQAQIPVSVIDSKGPTMSLGWQAMAATRACDEGVSMAEIVERVLPVYRATRIFGEDTVWIVMKGK